MNPYTPQNKVPVLQTVEELRHFIEKHSEEYICLYLAYKDKQAWEKSTSRIYLNQVHEELIYVPMNIEEQDFETIRRIYEIAEKEPRIIGINQTQPHKSNPVLRKKYGTEDKDADALIKNAEGKLLPYDLNGPSFVSWFTEEVGSFTNQHVVLLGVGGVGSPIARKIAKEKPKKLLLVDMHEKEKLAKELSVSCDARYQQQLPEKPAPKQLFINAAGKEGMQNTKQVIAFLSKREGESVFVDLRPQLNIPIVEKAKELGWQAYTGHGMNARNDYTLLAKLTECMQAQLISFSDFKELVKQAS